MSNSTKDTLHELIKYLTKSEKRYFKVYASRHILGDENNYIVLFDFIAKQEVYDEEAIFKHFKGEAFLNKFSISKKRLYDQIISALDNFHNTNSIDSQIYRLLSGAEILYKKSLYNQSLKQLISAKKIAQKHHKYNLLSEINYKMKQVYESQGNLDLTIISELLKEDESFHQKSLTFDTYWNVKSRLFQLLNSKGTSRSEEDLTNFKSIIDALLNKSTETERYFETIYLYNHIYSAYYFAINSYENCFSFLKQNITLIEKDSFAIKDRPNVYLSVLTNAIYVAYHLKKNEDLSELQEKLKNFSENETLETNEDLKIKLFSSLYSIEITLLILAGKIDAAVNLVPIIEDGLNLHDEKLTEKRKAFLHFKIASVFFYKTDYSKALKHINQILQNSSIDQQEELVSMAHILNLLIHLEQHNDVLIPYVIRNTQRYFKTRNRLFEFENTFLKFMSKMSKVKHLIEQEELWVELSEELNKMNISSFQHIVFEYFDFISWTKAKAARLSMEEIIKQKTISKH
jgi:hypothetical protein